MTGYALSAGLFAVSAILAPLGAACVIAEGGMRLRAARRRGRSS